jgi:hypothetical protein
MTLLLTIISVGPKCIGHVVREPEGDEFRLLECQSLEYPISTAALIISGDASQKTNLVKEAVEINMENPARTFLEQNIFSVSIPESIRVVSKRPPAHCFVAIRTQGNIQPLTLRPTISYISTAQ